MELLLKNAGGKRTREMGWAGIFFLLWDKMSLSFLPSVLSSSLLSFLCTDSSSFLSSLHLSVCLFTSVTVVLSPLFFFVPSFVIYLCLKAHAYCLRGFPYFQKIQFNYRSEKHTASSKVGVLRIGINSYQEWQEHTRAILR